MTEQSTALDSQICRVCGNDRQWHINYNPLHDFEPKQNHRIQRDVPSLPVPSMVVNRDLSVRLALIKAGILTEADLAEADTWLEQARVHNKALVVEPVPGTVDDWRYTLVTLEELASRVKAQASEKQPFDQLQLL